MSENRPTVLEINLENIARNTRTLKRIVGEAELMAVVKADAYGHGFEEVSRACLKNGASWLGVATIDEAMQLRNSGFHEPVLVLSGLFPENMDICGRNDIDITIQDSSFFKNFLQSGIKLDNVLNAHINIDTGMHRLGVLPDELFEVLEESKDFNEVNIRGIWTHFPEAENKDRTFTQYQLDVFDECIRRAEKILQKNITYKHAANTAAILNHKKSHYNMVRPGLGLYGYYDEPYLSKKAVLLPAIRMVSKIISIRDVKPGESISYGRTYVAKKKMKIATIPIGYADGYNRLHSNRGNALLRGKKTKIVGRVCMDQVMIDVSSFKNIRHGEEVVLFGRQKNKEISMFEMADILNTVPHDILVNFGKRIDRVYI